MGSKAKLIDKLAKFFPNADNFYDLFGGGFSVTHYMMRHRLKHYKNFYYNELRKETVDLVRDAINGKYNFDQFKPEWVDRDIFHSKKDSDAYIRFIWSFGNKGTSYLYGKHIENEKRSIHQAVVFNEFDDWFKNTFKIDKWPNSLSITGKRLYLKKIKTGLQNQFIERLEQLQRLEQLHLSSLSYDQVEIKPNSVIYCDIPYKGTADYGNSFDHDKFFDWAHAQENPVFISEYKVNDGRFHLLKEIDHKSTLSATNNTKKVTERLYGNDKAMAIIQAHRSGKSILLSEAKQNG